MKTRVLVFGFLFYSGIIISQTVPQNYQSLYNELSAKLQYIDSTITAKWDGEKYCTNYCTTLQAVAAEKFCWTQALLMP